MIRWVRFKKNAPQKEILKEEEKHLSKGQKWSKIKQVSLIFKLQSNLKNHKNSVHDNIKYETWRKVFSFL